MANIIYRDTDGDKSTLLPKGNLGYDDYPEGGDEGRVYVGTGTENIALSRKDESAILIQDNTTDTKYIDAGDETKYKMYIENGNITLEEIA